jgi:hypothetical protein
MKNSIIILLFLAVLMMFSCNQKQKFGKDGCKDEKCKSTNAPLTCKLTTVEMQGRKATVLASLRKQVLQKKELENGYAFKFPGNDKMIDELSDFAKTERHCCDFFTFNIAISGDTSSLWFEITGPKEVKEFIGTELEL